RIRLHGTPIASLAAIASSSTGVITTICSRYSTVFALLPQSRASDRRRDSMSRPTGADAVTTPGNADESIAALVAGSDNPGNRIDSPSSELDAPFTPQTHPTMPPLLSFLVASRKC